MSARVILALFFTLLISSALHSQTKTYTIKVAGIKIGSLYATHVKSGNFDYYSTNSIVEVFVFTKIKIAFTTEVLYNDSMLITSTVKSNINGAVYGSKTVWKKDHYDINCNTHNYSYKDTTLTTPIKWSTTKLYFHKPSVGTPVYTESYGNSGIMFAVKDKGLKMVSPRSKQIYYYNENAELRKIEVITSLKNFDMYAVDN